MPDTEGVEPKTMTIGTNNVFEVGCGILCDANKNIWASGCSRATLIKWQIADICLLADK